MNRVSLLVALAYVVIGVVFSALLRSVDVQVSRLAAWVASAMVAAAQIAYEHYRLASSPRATALHAAGAVALGAFGLALAANMHSWFAATPGHQSRLLLALVAWPVITALPAFVAALVTALVLARVSPRA